MSDMHLPTPFEDKPMDKKDGNEKMALRICEANHFNNFIPIKEALDAKDLHYQALLKQAMEDGYEDGFARGQEKKASCICTPTKVGDAYCEFHRPMFDRSRKDQMEVDAKIAQDNWANYTNGRNHPEYDRGWTDASERIQNKIAQPSVNRKEVKGERTR